MLRLVLLAALAALARLGAGERGAAAGPLHRDVASCWNVTEAQAAHFEHPLLASARRRFDAALAMRAPPAAAVPMRVPPGWRFASTPLRLLASTVLLPLATLLLLFALALRLSWGQPRDVPYDALERDDGSVPDECERDGEQSADPAGGDAPATVDFFPPTLPAI